MMVGTVAEEPGTAALRIGVVGLGALGFAITKRLIAQGLNPQVSDPDPTTLHYYMTDSNGPNPAASPTHLARMTNMILLAMSSDAALREVVVGTNGIVHGLAPGTVVVDMTSTDPEVGATLGRAVVPRGARWIEAQPIGPAQAVRTGSLTLLTGGRRDIVELARPVLDVLADRVIHLGHLGAGALARTIGGAMAGLALAATAEAMIVAKRSGLDPEGLLAAFGIIAPLAGTPPPALVDEVLTGRFASGYSLDRLIADLDRSLEAARRSDAPAPLTALVREFAAAARLAPEAVGDHTDLVRWLEAVARTELRAEPPEPSEADTAETGETEGTATEGTAGA